MRDAFLPFLAICWLLGFAAGSAAGQERSAEPSPPPSPPAPAPQGFGPYVPPTKPEGSLDSLNDTRRAPELSGLAIRALGARAEIARPRGDTEAGGALYERGLGLISHDWFNARYLDFLEIGADSEGLRYRVDLQLAAGPQWRYSDRHSIFARIGARAEISRAAGLYASALRAPELQIGHHSAAKQFQLDFAAHGSYMALGHVIPVGPKYTVAGAWAFGAYASVGWKRLRLDAEWTRLGSDDLRSDELRANACVLWAAHAVCGDARVIVAEVTPSRSRGHESLFIGLAILFGQIEWL